MSVTDPDAGAAVLFVCTGNICRSPAAELLLRAGAGTHAGLGVASAGLRAQVGRPVAPPMAALLRGRGVDPSRFRARQFLPALVRPATVVLTMTAEQRAAVVSQAPEAVRRTFTLREFVALAALSGPPEGRAADRLPELVAAAPRARARRGLAPDDDDINDPFGLPDDAHARALAVVAAAVTDLVELLVGDAHEIALPSAALPPLSGDLASGVMTQRSHPWSTAESGARWPVPRGSQTA